jgi:hypothetical protein
LVLESDLLTEEGISQALQHAVELCLRLGLHCLVGDISTFLLEYLEARREFDRLKTLCEEIAKLYAKGAKSETLEVEFVRIALRGAAPERLGMRDLIMATNSKGDLRTKVHECCTRIFGGEQFAIEHGVEPWPDGSTGNACRFAEVVATRAHITALDASKFTRDVPLEDKGWKAPIVRRYEFETETVLPSVMSIVAVKSCTTTEILKEPYLVDELRQREDEFRRTLKNITAILPSRSRAVEYSSALSQISLAPLIRLLRSIRDAPAEKCQNFLATALCSRQVDAPRVIVDIVDAIAKRVRKALCLCEEFATTKPFERRESDVLDFYIKNMGLDNYIRRGSQDSQ